MLAKYFRKAILLRMFLDSIRLTYSVSNLKRRKTLVQEYETSGPTKPLVDPETERAIMAEANRMTRLMRSQHHQAPLMKKTLGTKRKLAKPIL